MLTRYIPLLIAFLLISSCTTETGRRLIHVDSIMEQHPDSAMAILGRIDKHTLKDSELPYYALLYTQAQIKTDIPLDSDSLIRIAYAKYGANTGGDRGIRSNFYIGEILFNQEKYREAMKFYLTAYEESKRLNNDYWHAKAAERISDLFFYAYNYDEAASYAAEAAELFKNVGRPINCRFLLAKLADIWLNDTSPESAYILLDSLKNLSLSENPIDTTFLEYIRMPWIDALEKTGRLNNLKHVDWNFSGEDLSDRERIDAVILQSHISNHDDKSFEIVDILRNVESFAHSDEVG